jgi:hypothetical protein
VFSDSIVRLLVVDRATVRRDAATRQGGAGIGRRGFRTLRMFPRVTVDMTAAPRAPILGTHRSRCTSRLCDTTDPPTREKDIVTRQPSPTAKDALLRAASGQGAEMFDDGYALHPITRQAAIATPSHWADAFVVAVHEDGWIELAGFAGEPIRCWHFDDLREVLTPGAPVAVHALYGVLAADGELLNVDLAQR